MPGLAEWFNNMSRNLYRNFIIGLTLLIGLAGCDSGTQWEDSQYEVTWIDTGEIDEFIIVLMTATVSEELVRR